jgi:tetratricopeptide (TPR) repeat protein
VEGKQVGEPACGLPECQRLGDFEIGRELGRGGMGIVYEARQLSLNRKVAIKVLSSGLGLTPKAVARFHREAEAAGKLHHTNIVPIYATGADHGLHYYAMELIEGPSLDQVLQRLKREPAGHIGDRPVGSSELPAPSLAETGPYIAGRGPLSLPTSAVNSSGLSSDSHYFDTVARMIAPVADALQYAHDHGVIHRDIKPSNLLLSPDARLSVNDFGLARMLEQPGMTMTGEFVGTPAYMSPEQITAGRTPLDNRTDIYSLGATLYELLTLEPPFKGESREQVLAQIMYKEPKAPRRINKGVPVDLETICLKALEKDPDRRYQTAGQMADDLRRFVDRFAISARRAGPVARGVKWVRRRPALAATCAFALILAVAAAFFAYEANVTEQRRMAEQVQHEQQLLAEKQQNVLEKALLAAMTGDFDSADKEIDEAELLGASPGQVQMMRGQIAFDRGDSKEAIQHLEMAVKLLPDSVAARALLVRAYRDGGQMDRYIGSMQELERLSPVTPEDFLFKGRAEAWDDPAWGLPDLAEAIRRLPGSSIARLARAEAQVTLAMITVSSGEAELAIQYANTAKDMLPGNPVALFFSMEANLIAAITCGQNGQQERRQATLEQAKRDLDAMEPFGTLPITLRARKIFFDETGDEKQLLEESRRAREQTDHPDVISEWARILYRLGRFQDALQILDRIGPQAGAISDVEVARAYILAELPAGQSKALAAYEAAVKASSSVFVPYWPNTVLRLLGRKQQAIEACRNARKQDERVPWRREWNRKVLEYQCGDLTAEQLLQAAPLRGDQCEAHFYIAMTLLAEGDRQGARSHFQKSVDTGVVDFFERNWSRGFLSCMQSDPGWPAWIPIRK